MIGVVDGEPRRRERPELRDDRRPVVVVPGFSRINHRLMPRRVVVPELQRLRYRPAASRQDCELDCHYRLQRTIGVDAPHLRHVASAFVDGETPADRWCQQVEQRPHREGQGRPPLGIAADVAMQALVKINLPHARLTPDVMRDVAKHANHVAEKKQETKLVHLLEFFAGERRRRHD